MSDATLNLPPDPEPGTQTGSVAPDAPWEEHVQQLADDVAQVVTTPTVNTPVPPSVILDASGVPHAVIPLTKSTKAYIGTALAGVSFLGLDSAAFLPDSFKPWALGAATVAGIVATFLGIHLPTNLPKRSDKV